MASDIAVLGNSGDRQDPEAEPSAFDLERFLPYLLNQSAEATGKGFQAIYHAEYGLTRTQWRIVANLGKFGAMTASTICRISHIEKSKVSRAVSLLDEAGILVRGRDESDRRAEKLALTARGQAIFDALGRRAQHYDRDLREALGAELAQRLEEALRTLARFDHPSVGDLED